MPQTSEPSRMDTLIGDFDLLPFRELPLPYKMAIAWYMAIDGDAWSDVIDGIPFTDHDAGQSEFHTYWKQALVDRMPQFDEAYGDVHFGVTTIATEDVLASIARDDVNVAEGIDLDEVRNRYASGGKHSAYPDHGPNDRWPVVLSSHDDETLQDGWHRFGAYAGAGHLDVPAFFYPDDRHFAMKDMPVPGKDSNQGFSL